ncbi:Isochorismatase [Pseudoalteromonas luteoviolacea B = ATCC 29581]|nr:Isochorismatase [Pseudoalteromonas luteoviolacea B = ATCC 29581]
MLTVDNTGLILVDVQGQLARQVVESQHVIEQCCKLVKSAQILGLPIVWLEQSPTKLGQTVPELQQLLGDLSPIVKTTFDACRQSKFLIEIEKSGKVNWLICGIEAHICVYQTASRLLQVGYKVHVVNDAISSRHQRNIDLATNKLMQRGAELTGVEMCLFELLVDAKVPQFKLILDVVKAKT